MFRTSFLALCAALSSGATLAQPVPGDEVTPGEIYTRGYVQFELIENGEVVDGDDYVVGGDFRFGLAPDTGGAVFGLGFDFGIDGYAFEDSSLETPWASALVQSPYGLVSVGLPRDALDDYIHRPLFGGTVLGDASLLLWDRSTTALTAFILDETPLGLRFDGQAGDIGFGASIHRFDEVDATTASAAARMAVGDFAFSLGVDYLSDDVGTDTGIHASAVLDYGTAGGTVMYSDGALIDQRILQVSGFLRPIDRTKVEVSFVDVDSEFDGWAVSGEYAVTPDIYVNLGYLEFESDGTLDLGVGFRF